MPLATCQGGFTRGRFFTAEFAYSTNVSGVPVEVSAEERQPYTKQKRQPLQLSLERALELALENNYDLLLAQEAVRESKGVASTRLGALLPNIRGESGNWRQKTFQCTNCGYDLRASTGNCPECGTARIVSS